MNSFESIDRDSPVPLYLQIRQKLVAMIADWPDAGQRFHTDDELARMFDVAKTTVRQAVADLTQSGLLRRQRGAGTFVVPPLVEKLRPNPDIEDQYELAGAQVAHRVHSFDLRGASDAEARALGIRSGDEVVFLRRVRSIAHVPVAIDDRVMTRSTATRLGLTVETATSSIIDRVRRRFHLTRASWQLSAVLAGRSDALMLQLAPSDPILVRALTYFQGEEPILTGETRHRSDLIRCGFEMDLSAQSPTGDPRTWTSEALLVVAGGRS